MATVRAIWGPFGRSVNANRNGKIIEITWGFNGIRGDYTVAHWVLKYKFEAHRMYASGITLPRKSAPAPGNEDMFLPNPGGNPQTGLIVDMLSARLSTDDHALIQRIRITGKI